jgi:tetratricopeptide (TPR) repeat protein
LAAAVATSLSYAPADRSPALADLLVAFDALRPAPVVELSDAPRRRRLWWFGLAAAAAASVIGVSAFGVAKAAVDRGSSSTTVAATAPAPPAQPISGEVVLFAPRPAAPDPGEINRARAHACWGSEWTCAIDALTALSLANPSDPAIRAKLADAHVNRGLALARSGDVVAANGAFQEAIAVQSDHVEAQLSRDMATTYQRGAAAYDHADWRVAIEAFESVAAIDRAFGDASGYYYASLTNGGIRALQSGDLASATAWCGQAAGLLRGGPADLCLNDAQARLVVRPAAPTTATTSRPAPRPATSVLPPELRNAPLVTINPQPPARPSAAAPRHRLTYLP